jgi:DNA polymerase-3 subunit gamma/tau
VSQALALKYRPKTFDDLTEQSAIKTILENQIKTKTVKNAYLFVGPAGCGKTTSARIFANMINEGKGTPIELDAASNNSVDDIRRITEQAQTISLDSTYKIFILDEVHSLSNQAWQAFLKTLEEPPVFSIFIMCTTEVQKVPATILSRAQMYRFQKISTEGIVDRLQYIVDNEFGVCAHVSEEALQYIAKLASGGMRDAITLLDKCLSYSEELTIDDVVTALGVADYTTMVKLTRAITSNDMETVVGCIDYVYNSGADLKQFVKTYFDFILEANIYCITKKASFVKIPENVLQTLSTLGLIEYDNLYSILQLLTELQSTIRYEQNARAVILAKLLLFMEGTK